MLKEEGSDDVRVLEVVLGAIDVLWKLKEKDQGGFPILPEIGEK